ncbi:MAG: hypothetical protein L6R37_006336, partial [Teloschistes peruensis]
MEAQVLDFIKEERPIIIYYLIYYIDSNSLFVDYEEPFVQTGIGAIHWAAFVGSEKIILALLEKGHDPQVLDGRGRTALMYAAYGGDEAMIKMLLDTPDMDVNIADEEGCTPLYFAAMSGHELVVRLLLEQKIIDVNPRESVDGHTPLLAACESEEDTSTIVQLLTSVSHVDVNCVGEDGWGALHYARFYKDSEGALLKILLERKDILVNVRINGRQIHMRWNHGCTPLMVAAQYGNEAAVRLLLKRGGVDMSCRSVDGVTALMLAYKRGHKSIVNLLKNAGAEGEIPATELRDCSPDEISK